MLASDGVFYAFRLMAWYLQASRFMRWMSVVLICASAAACAKGVPGDNRVAEAVCQGDSRSQLTINNDAADAAQGDRYIAVNQGQEQAIGYLTLESGSACSGTLIHDRWVLTAKHCTETPAELPSSARFETGPRGNARGYSFRIARLVPHPHADNDILLAELSESAASRLPQVQPLGLSREHFANAAGPYDFAAAGFGEGSQGDRRFVGLTDWDVNNQHILAWAAGAARGVCSGDSGGPLMHRDADKVVRIAGVLHRGILPDSIEDCQSVDAFSRVDPNADFGGRNTAAWIKEVVCNGSECLGMPRGCAENAGAADASSDGAVDGSAGASGPGAIRSPLVLYGSCQGRGVVLSCDGNEQVETFCDEGEICGWDTATRRYDCIDPADDPCDGITLEGRCNGAIAEWCAFDTAAGQPLRKQRDCASCNQVCVNSSIVGGVDCQPNECGGLSEEGRCNGEVAEWCEGGTLTRVNCSTLDGDYRCGSRGGRNRCLPHSHS